MIRHEPWLGEELVKHGFLIRDLSNIPPLMKGYFRISIKTKEINDLFLNILSKLR
ncbi:hypothetical protein [Vulcanisaeta sp. JCM 16161]|uniref:hypothetical protein n=1 Tax=Vulcanisaeta sp. JCM 16161 TaxID=1295372 RepID=UPI000A9B6A4F|nr:hypothetical protein [Vulcanisaeta sp. JCM 16161]